MAIGAGAYELQTRPFSPWIDAFTHDEWVAFGYVQSLSYYYCAGCVFVPIITNRDMIGFI